MPPPLGSLSHFISTIKATKNRSWAPAPPLPRNIKKCPEPSNGKIPAYALVNRHQFERCHEWRQVATESLEIVLLSVRHTIMCVIRIFSRADREVQLSVQKQLFVLLRIEKRPGNFLANFRLFIQNYGHLIADTVVWFPLITYLVLDRRIEI